VRGTAHIIAILLFTVAFDAAAQSASDYPNKVIRVIVPYAAGGTDHQMRALAPTFSKLLGQPIVVENREGGGGTIGANAVKSASPDGHTLLYSGTGVLTVGPNMRRGVPYTIDDFVPIGNVTGTAFIMAARPDAPFKTLAELVAYARANPGRVNFGSAGVGTTTHMSGAAFEAAAKAPLTHVPFQGIGPAVRGLLGGQVDIVIGLASAIAPQFASGKVIPIATTGKARSEWAPNVPTWHEAGYEVIEVTKFGLFAPRGTPEPITQKLIAVLAEAVQAPEFIELAKKTYNTIQYIGPSEFRTVLENENKYFRRLIAELKLGE
jgi:tripartite-type tricarboxylate transporter receptor subunit TctC